MFDWVPKKKFVNTTTSQKSDEVDFGELFSTDTDTINKKKIPVDMPIINSEPAPHPIKNEKPSINETPVPAQTHVDDNNSTYDSYDIEIGEASELHSGVHATKHELVGYTLDDEKISPTGAASSHQDVIRSNRPPSEKWEIPEVLKFLNNVDTNEVFSSPIAEVKEVEKAPKLKVKAPAIPKMATKATPKQSEPVVEEIIEEDENAAEDELIKKLIKQRYPNHSGKESFDNELKTSSSPYINAFFDTQDAPPTMIVDDFGDRSLWELQLNNSNLPGMELEEFSLISFDHIHLVEMRRGYKRARRDFLKLISYHNQQDLYAAGLDDIDIAMLRKGHTCENFNVHRKIPYEYGGNNDFSNFCFMQTHPYHDNLHKFLDMQIFIHPTGAKVKRLFIPIPNGNVYVPYLDITGSGGKSKHDRSVYAGFHEETFNLIAQKTAMGKAAEL